MTLPGLGAGSTGTPTIWTTLIPSYVIGLKGS